MPILLAHGVERRAQKLSCAEYRSWVYFCWWNRTAPENDYPRICATRLVKLTPGSSDFLLWARCLSNEWEVDFKAEWIKCGRFYLMLSTMWNPAFEKKINILWMFLFTFSYFFHLFPRRKGTVMSAAICLIILNVMCVILLYRQISLKSNHP
jgi:hypothetical protein